MQEPETFDISQAQRELWEWQQRELPLRIIGMTEDEVAALPAAVRRELIESRLIRGATEEIGELCHASLKQAQMIRHSYEECEELKEDAIADVVIFLLNLSSHLGIDFGRVLKKVINKILKRVW